MKLARLETAAGARPAMMDAEDRWRDLSGVIEDVTRATLAPETLEQLRAVDAATLPEVTGRPLPFLADFGRVFCIGLNYQDHADEIGLPAPPAPILFMKACAVTGATDPIVIPKGATQVDWEVELGVVIGSRAQHVTEAGAMAHVAGYCVANDVSERDFQMNHGGQWVKGKSCDGFAPVGPCLVTADEVADPQDLALTLDVNGIRQQDGSTRTMIFGVAEIVAHLSRYLTLLPGDLILTGTPPGVGMGQKPPRYLAAGDRLRAEIAGLGAMEQEVLAYEA